MNRPRHMTRGLREMKVLQRCFSLGPDDVSCRFAGTVNNHAVQRDCGMWVSSWTSLCRGHIRRAAPGPQTLRSQAALTSVGFGPALS